MTPRRLERRRGLTLIPSLVCLVVATAICGSILRQVHIQRGLARGFERQAQADWLADSGLERGAVRLAADENYSGETWNVGPETLGGLQAGFVRLVVLPVEKQPGKRSVRVEAVYPAGVDERARQSRTISIDLNFDPSKGIR